MAFFVEDNDTQIDGARCGAQGVGRVSARERTRGIARRKAGDTDFRNRGIGRRGWVCWRRGTGCGRRRRGGRAHGRLRNGSRFVRGRWWRRCRSAADRIRLIPCNDARVGAEDVVVDECRFAHCCLQRLDLVRKRIVIHRIQLHGLSHRRRDAAQRADVLLAADLHGAVFDHDCRFAHGIRRTKICLHNDAQNCPGCRIDRHRAVVSHDASIRLQVCNRSCGLMRNAAIVDLIVRLLFQNVEAEDRDGLGWPLLTFLPMAPLQAAALCGIDEHEAQDRPEDAPGGEALSERIGSSAEALAFGDLRGRPGRARRFASCLRSAAADKE